MTSHVLIQSLVRQVSANGGFATILHKGDVVSGAIIIACVYRGSHTRLYERMSDFSDGYKLMAIAEKSWGNEGEIAGYINRRKASDPDLWVVELDIPNGEQLAAGVFGSD